MPHTLESKSFKLRSSAKQVERMRGALPALKGRMDATAALAERLDKHIPPRADGYAVIINPEQWGDFTIAGALEAWKKFAHLQLSTPEGNTFPLSPGSFHGNRFTLEDTSTKMYKRISTEQGSGPILIIPIRFDHVSTVLDTGEFHVGMVACVSLFITHMREFEREPVVHGFELACTGETYCRHQGGAPTLQPTVGFKDHLLRFRLRDPNLCTHKIQLIGMTPDFPS